ncbi:MAG: hypothetical protein ACYCY8_00670 [Burkholderiales bacterium]
MRFMIFLLLLPLSACSGGSGSNIKVGTVFSPNPDVVTCPTSDLLEKIRQYAAAKNEKDYNSMLLDGGGLCTTLPSAATLSVAEVAGDMIRVRPASAPNAKGVWASPRILEKPDGHMGP